MTLARHILRSGIQINRASVGRILEEDRPTRDGLGESRESHERAAPDHFFNSSGRIKSGTWIRRCLGCSGCASRSQRSSTDSAGRSSSFAPTAARRPQPIWLQSPMTLCNAIAAPRFLVTDRGGQFQKMFPAAIAERGICHARGQPRAWQFNTKVERLFWSPKKWWRVSLVVPNVMAIQKRLDRTPHGTIFTDRIRLWVD